METPPSVYVVDDDVGTLKSVSRLLEAAGFAVRGFHSSLELLVRWETGDGPCCFVIDLSMPEMDGLALQEALTHCGESAPVVFITGHGNVSSSVRAMKAGAVDFLSKPFEASDLLAAVRAAVKKDLSQRAKREERLKVKRKLAVLTPREHEVLAQLVQGKLNKQIAAELGAAEKTIKVHRARVLNKMEAHSIAELVRMTERAELQTEAK